MLAEADGEDAEVFATRAQTRNRIVAYGLGAVQRELALGQIASKPSHLEDGLVRLLIEGGGALGELAAHGDDNLAAVRLDPTKAARRQRGDSALGLGEAGDADRIGAQDAPDGLDHRVERGRARRATSLHSAVPSFRPLALILPESPTQGPSNP